MTAAGNEAETAHPVQEDFDVLILLIIILFIQLFYCLFCSCNFEVFSFILVSAISS